MLSGGVDLCLACLCFVLASLLLMDLLMFLSSILCELLMPREEFLALLGVFVAGQGWFPWSPLRTSSRGGPAVPKKALESLPCSFLCVRVIVCLLIIGSAKIGSWFLPKFMIVFVFGTLCWGRWFAKCIFNFEIA